VFLLAARGRQRFERCIARPRASVSITAPRARDFRIASVDPKRHGGVRSRGATGESRRLADSTRVVPRPDDQIERSLASL